jgi:hypothetical protein
MLVITRNCLINIELVARFIVSLNCAIVMKISLLFVFLCGFKFWEVFGCKEGGSNLNCSDGSVRKLRIGKEVDKSYKIDSELSKSFELRLPTFVTTGKLKILSNFTTLTNI